MLRRKLRPGWARLRLWTRLWPTRWLRLLHSQQDCLLRYHWCCPLSHLVQRLVCCLMARLKMRLLAQLHRCRMRWG